MNEKILNIIIEAITSEKMNWQRTWTWTGAKNYVTKKTYRGANSYLNFIWDNFATFNQIKSLNAKLKKGSKGYPVVYALIKEDEEIQNNTKFCGWKYYTVFNCEDVEGLPQETQINPETIASETIQNTNTNLQRYFEKEKIQLTYWEPAYSLTNDNIIMPHLTNFKNDLTEYTAVLSHEAIHSTWIEKRLNRFWKNPLQDHKFWSPDYAKEELVAELWAILLTWNRVSKNSIAYIQSWIQKLKKEDNKKDIFDAFRLAQKATDFILS